MLIAGISVDVCNLPRFIESVLLVYYDSLGSFMFIFQNSNNSL